MADNFLNKTIAEKYRIDATLHSGETESLYAGIHLPTNRPVTVKLLSSALSSDQLISERFIDEAKAASQISHPNILNITDFGIDNNKSAYIVYESFIGEPLTEVLAKESKLDPSRAVSIANEIALALTAIHSTGKTIGSLNPNEVIILDHPSQSGQVKLVNISNDHYDSDDLSLFRVYYLSPEQCIDITDADERSDIYSLGVMMYQMLAGEPPFLADNTTSLMMKHVEEMPPPLSSYRTDLPPDIESTILKALSKDPEMRQQSADEFIADLAALNIRPKALTAAVGSNKKWLTAFLVLIGVGVLAGLMIYATSSKQTFPTTVLQHDVNGMPVQPLNPATGVEEMRMLASMPAGTAGFDNPTDAALIPPPDTIPGGDNYNPWAAGGAPPAGAPPQGYVPPGGQTYTIDPNGSQFMPNESGVVLVPVPATPRPSPNAPKPGDSGEATIQPTPKPQPKPAEPKPTTAPKKPVEENTQTTKPAGNSAEPSAEID